MAIKYKQRNGMATLAPTPMIAPSDLGLPPKFTAYRRGQDSVILDIAASRKRFTMLSAPTGCVAGDTVITVARGGALLASKKRTIESEFRNQSNPARRNYATFTRSWQGDRIGRHATEGVVYSGVRETYTLTLVDGKQLRATPDHAVLTTNGWKELAALTGVDRVVCDSSAIPYGRKSPKKAYRQVQGLVYHPFASGKSSYVIKSRCLKPEGRLYAVPYHRLVVEAHINGMSVLDLITICRREPEVVAALQFLDPAEFAVHHKDTNSTNNHIDNLEVKTHRKHAEEHGYGKHFDTEVREIAVNNVVRHGEEDTYDLRCADPHHNFVANGIVVHNSGKSIIYMSIAQMLGLRAVVLTSTKGLQAQLSADFGAMGLTDVRGQNNYLCAAAAEGGILGAYAPPNVTCEEGPCHAGIDCPLKGDLMDDEETGCPYRDAVRRARRAPLVVTNYAYWMTANAYMEDGALGKFSLIILDEAHAASDELADFCSVRLDKDELKSMIGERIPPLDEGTEAWASWAARVRRKADTARDIAEREMAAAPVGNKRMLARRVKKLRDLKKKLDQLAKAHQWLRSEAGNPDVLMPGMETDWVAEPTPTGALFSPVWAHAYAEQYLFAKAQRVVLVSAVLQRATAKYLGIPDNALDFTEMGSTFDPSRRPLIYVPTTTVDRHMNEGQIKIWVNRIDSIIGKRLDRKGIIHTRSYERARTILQRSKYKAFMIGHNSRTTRETVARFMASTAPCILVSPSVEEGYDFPMDLCRYQIIAKVPFVDSRSALMRARVKSDKSYMDYLTTMSVIQQVGRGMRAEADACESFIVDDHWAWWRRSAARLFPLWFRAAWRDATNVDLPREAA